jgi:hypothetical protein
MIRSCSKIFHNKSVFHSLSLKLNTYAKGVGPYMAYILWNRAKIELYSFLVKMNRMCQVDDADWKYVRSEVKHKMEKYFEEEFSN